MIRFHARLATLLFLTVISCRAAAAQDARIAGEAQRHDFSDAYGGTGLGGGAYEEMSALLEVTIFGIDVLELTVWVDPPTGERLRRLLPGRRYDDALADSVAAAVLDGTELWARQILVRDVGFGRMLDGMRGTARRAAEAGYVSRAYYEQFSERLPELFGFLAEDGAREGDQIYFHSRGDTVRTVYRTADGRVMLDRRIVEPQARRATVPSFFAPGTRFRERLVRSVLGEDSLAVPRFAADDPRIGTAGFVGLTRRVTREVEGTSFTLMVFAVGDVLTLGAMVEGPFDGIAEWAVGGRSLTVPLSREGRGMGAIPTSEPGLTGAHGGFDEFDWVNVEVPLAEWLPDGTSVRLLFTPSPEGAGRSVRLPEEGWFVMTVVGR